MTVRDSGPLDDDLTQQTSGNFHIDQWKTVPLAAPEIRREIRKRRITDHHVQAVALDDEVKKLQVQIDNWTRELVRMGSQYLWLKGRVDPTFQQVAEMRRLDARMQEIHNWIEAAREEATDKLDESDRHLDAIRALKAADSDWRSA